MLSSIPAKARWLVIGLLGLVSMVIVVAASATIGVILALPNLPSLEALTDYRPKRPMQVYTADGHLIGEFGEERRSVVRIEDVPPAMKQAILAAEDERFYEHGGIDTLGIVRATLANLVSGGKKQGASTITMQVARNFYLSSEKTLSRKFYEILLSFKIEHSLSKDHILQLYINQIYLGQRAYGFASAAQTYFGKSMKDLSIAEAAMLAGLPKAPSAYNPVANPKRAKLRQMYVIRRMRELDFISDAQKDAAEKEPLHVRRSGDDPLEGGESYSRAAFVSEMARQMVIDRFPEDAYTRGYKVYTTIIKSDQDAAYAALRKAVMDYDRRHGYRQPEAYLDLKEIRADQEETLDELLSDFAAADDLIPAIVLEADKKQVKLYRHGGEVLTLKGNSIKFASRALDLKAPANKRIRRGAVVRIQAHPKAGWIITQLPDVEAAFVSANPRNGAIRALIGGFDFSRNKFNHVTQAWRQPGSSFKPFIYSAALEKGFTPATIIEDSPILVPASETGNTDWEPKNYDGKYEGPMTLRTALTKSKNMVSIRILQAITPQYAQDYASRFGFDPAKNPPYLTLALGAGAVTPWQSLAAYAVFANGGYKIQPHLVREIRDENNTVLASFENAEAGDETLRVIDARNAYIMDSLLRDVTIRGTAARAAAALKRHDLAGKTGTTNDYIDAWFAGYQQQIVGIAWIGFDQPKRLGNGETGGSAALPIWIDYMAKALKGIPESIAPPPEGLVGVSAIAPDGETTNELLYQESVPVDEAPADETIGEPPLPNLYYSG
jgi:penicillin-binding protein 1A